MDEPVPPRAEAPLGVARGYAEFLDGWSLTARPVVAEVRQDGLHIGDADGTPIARWDRAGLSRDAAQVCVMRVGHSSASQESLAVRDAALAAAILKAAFKRDALPGGSSELRFARMCLVALVALGSAAYASVPATSRFVAERIPPAQERGLGRPTQRGMALRKL